MSVFNVAERTMPELTDDMTVADLVDVLEHLRFPGGQPTTLRIDRGVCDYLVRLLRAVIRNTSARLPAAVAGRR